jgi:glycerol-3-phosphate acyltransferase PlsY
MEADSPNLIGYIAAALLGYLLGSIPFGLVITKLAGLGDIRAIGSGNIGATNVLRTGRKDLALATLLLDAGKAGLAFLICWQGALVWLQTRGGVDPASVNSDAYSIGLIGGAFAFVGHCFPVWKGRRHLYRIAARSGVAGRACLGRDVAGGCFPRPHVVARRTCGLRGRSGLRLCI